MASGLGVKRKFVSTDRISLDGLPRTCGSLFLDSGAHSLYQKHTLNAPRGKEYRFYVKKGKLTPAYRKYLNDYARFVRKYKKGIDYYVNVDAIYNPEISWMALKYLEDQGIEPIPVIHHRTPLKWVDKHLEAGYKFLGLGGLGQKSTRGEYTDWGDRVFDLLCNNYNRLPIVRTHGFAMSSYDLMIRYPWWSVDSASWAKAAAVGTVMIPHKRKGVFTFAIKPHLVDFNIRPLGGRTAGSKSFLGLPTLARGVVCEWLEKIDVPIGSCNTDGTPKDYGVVSQYNARAIANLKFFQALCDWLPEWPWSFNIRPERRFF